ncbi:MAG: hypothetical protein WDN04_24955 [Rhodospirillales bacterium]
MGIDPPALEKQCSDLSFYEKQGLGSGIFFSREEFGADKLVVGMGSKPFRDLLKDAPLSDRVKADAVRIFTGVSRDGTDPMPGLTSAQKKEKLARISYATSWCTSWAPIRAC